jgi:hypothetical protein
MTIISSLVRRHVSAKYNHHQANKESRFRYIKCAPNGIPLCLLYGYMDQYCKHNGILLPAHFIYLNLDSVLV